MLRKSYTKTQFTVVSKRLNKIGEFEKTTTESAFSTHRRPYAWQKCGEMCSIHRQMIFVSSFRTNRNHLKSSSSSRSSSVRQTDAPVFPFSLSAWAWVWMSLRLYSHSKAFESIRFPYNTMFQSMWPEGEHLFIRTFPFEWKTIYRYRKVDAFNSTSPADIFTMMISFTFSLWCVFFTNL